MLRAAFVAVVLLSCSRPKEDCVELGTAAPSVSAIPSASTTSPAARSRTLGERARSGELSALKQLELTPLADRSTEDSAAIAAGHAVLGKEAAATLGREIAEKPELLGDRNVLSRLFSYASDPVTAEVGLPVLARIEKPVGPDMLYEIWKHDGYAPTRSLAEDLLVSRAVRKRASKELELVLDLEREERCERLQKLLEEAGERVDRRVLPRLDALDEKQGCGEKKAEDCFPCLRDGDLIQRVRAQAEKKKKQPREWEIRRR